MTAASGFEALDRDVHVVLERPSHRVVEGQLEHGPGNVRGRAGSGRRRDVRFLRAGHRTGQESEGEDRERSQHFRSHLNLSALKEGPGRAGRERL